MNDSPTNNEGNTADGSSSPVNKIEIEFLDSESDSRSNNEIEFTGNRTDNEFDTDWTPETALVQTLVPWATALTISRRVKFFVTGVVFPAICFAMIEFGGMYPSMNEPWQSGRTEDHIAVLLGSPTVFVFTPLLLFSVFCISIFCWNPGSGRNWVVRMGLEAGVALSLMFLVILFVPTAIAGQVIALMVAAALAFVVWIGGLLFRKQFSIKYLLLMTGLAALVMGLDAANDHPIGRALPELLFVTGVFITAAAPTLSFLTYARSTAAAHDINTRLQLANQTGEFLQGVRIPIIGAWITWLAALVATWRYALIVEAIEYSKLPTTNPNCYVSSAAAHGHRRLVGARPIGVGLVNLQMKRLKLLELALAVKAPVVHLRMRKLYNAIGPILANVCRRNVWFADATFVLLKPIEWFAFGLQLILKIDSQIVQRIYTRCERHQ